MTKLTSGKKSRKVTEVTEKDIGTLNFFSDSLTDTDLLKKRENGCTINAFWPSGEEEMY